MKQQRKILGNKSNQEFDFDILPMIPNQSNRLQCKEITLQAYDYKLFGEITEVEDYFDIIDALNHASPDEEFIIRIHSGGGLLGTADVIVNAISNTQARVHGHIESLCGSAATMIFLSCHSYSVSPRAEFFVHTASSGTIGKEHENYASIMFSRKRIHRLIKDTYSGLLSEKEIENVLNGQDYYFDAEELSERLESFTEYQRNKYEEEMEKISSAIPDEEKEEPLIKKILVS